MEKRGKRNKTARGQTRTLPVRLLIGVGTGAGVCVVGLLLCAVLISAGRVGERNMGAAVLVCAAAGGLGAGLTAVRGGQLYRVPVGLGAGLLLFLLLLFIGQLAYSRTAVGTDGVKLLCACVGGGGTAGLLSRRSKGKKRRPGVYRTD